MRTIYRAEPPWPHRVLILGGGFAGVMTAQALERRLGRRTDVEVWLVSRDNFMLFTPLLPEVCSGALEPRHVVSPLRGMLRRPSSWCITADVESVDLDGSAVKVMGRDGDLHTLRYDTLVHGAGRRDPRLRHPRRGGARGRHEVAGRCLQPAQPHDRDPGARRPGGGPRREAGPAHLRGRRRGILGRRDGGRGRGLHPARAKALLPEAAPDRCQRPPGGAARPDPAGDAGADG